MSKLEKWHTYAELASKEKDPAKLMELAERLREALDRDLQIHVSRHALPHPQETT